MKKVIIIFGPTGIGKTKLSIELAKELNGEIISADSMQIYKKMNIGTAKVSEEEKQGIPHHMLDIIPPDEEYNVGEYVKETKQIIERIISCDKVPIIVGGTGLYINALINNYDFNNAIKDERIREKYNKLVEERGKEFVYELLKNADPIRASQIHPNDIKRVIRALEIIEINKNELENNNNKKTSQKTLKNEEKIIENYKYLIFGLNMNREKLYENINLRVEKMFAKGLVNEVKSLLKSGVKKESQSMQGIGYKEVLEGWERGLGEEEIKDLIKQRTRNYAKRQLTFMRGMKDIIWVDVEEKVDEILKKIKEI